MESKSGSDGGRNVSKGILGLRMIVSPSIQLQRFQQDFWTDLDLKSNDARVLVHAAIHLHNPLSPFFTGFSQLVDHKRQEI